MAGLRLFAEQGFARTSTRAIAQAAGTNVAAIRYYFGDKAGLYRAAFTEPMGSPHEDIALYDQPTFSVEESLQRFMAKFLEPMQHGELVDQSMRLHFRELLEPTSVWQEEVHNGIKPAHEALVRVLCRHLQLQKPDDEVHRLAFAIVALPIYLYVCRDIVDALRPRLLAGDRAMEEAAERLTMYALALVSAEAQRRKAQRGAKG
ncbi:MAG: Transcriptional regulator, AcrR family [uncultured Ramlibacter sp.]|uniref:Transcriptional regulator, AcrR family n=1 Tax=uncultured Ramlibacter sp. TaxID=260755 RepID=A0A6J4NU63_9BURK|nr:MAG: Transcriptional regulator, AcrR family [uncultured Ramlibacter sp.]